MWNAVEIKSGTRIVSSILNKVSTYAGKGEVEIVEKAVDLIREYNARSGKPVITARNRFFQLLALMITWGCRKWPARTG